MDMTADPPGDAATDLVRWAVTNPHHDRRTDTAYELTPEGDRKAWLDRLSTSLARDRADITRATRRGGERDR